MVRNVFVSVTLLLLSSCLVTKVSAFGRRNRGGGGYNQHVNAPATSVAVGETATAQGVANIMARCGRVGHWGGNPGYEGCGMASTAQGAYGICCYANSGMKTIDVGYAQGSNGMWYCCRRYQ